MAGERYITVDTPEKFGALLGALQAADMIGFDLETNTLDWSAPDAEIVGWAFSTREREGWYIPVAHTKGPNLDPAMVLHRVKPILEDPNKIFVIHNAKFDTRFTRSIGITIDPVKVDDSYLLAYVASARDHLERFGLKEIEERLWHIKPVSFDSLFPAKTKVKNIATVDVAVAGYYACADADFCLRIANRYLPDYSHTFVWKLESQLWPVIQRIEEHGVKINVEALQKMSAYIFDQAKRVEQVVWDHVEKALGRRIEFSISSPKQLGEILFDMMGLPVKVKTPTGSPSTAENALAPLEDAYPVVRAIAIYRSMLTNARAMLKWAGSVGLDGRIHTDYNQAGATSGRLASSNPNVQNIGKIKKWEVPLPDGSKYVVLVTPRDAFIPGEGKYLIESDFAAIEFVIFAKLAGEMAVVEEYERGGDVHKQTASDIWSKKREDITPDERELAKTVNYLIIYMGGPERLAQETQKPLGECEAIIKRFYEVRPKFAKYQQESYQKAFATKKVSTAFGREQIVPEFFEAGKQAASKARRACVNRKIQGTAADVHKAALIRTANRMAQLYSEDQARMILQTHDSQTWEVDLRISPDEIIPRIVDSMAKQMPGMPRIRVDAKVGMSWGTMESWDPAKPKDWTQVWADQDQALHRMFDEMPEPEIQLPMEVEALPSSSSGQNARLLLDPGCEVSEDQARQLKDLLRSFPGNNVVILKMEDDSITFSRQPTSLNARALQATLGPIFPGCSVEVDRASLLAAVMG